MTLFLALLMGSLLLAAFGVTSLPARRQVRRRLAHLADGSVAPVPARSEGLLAQEYRSWLVRLLSPLAREPVRGARNLLPLQRRLVQAGYRRPGALVVYTGGRLALATALPLLVLLARPVWQLGELELLALLGAAASLGFLAPAAALERARKARQRALRLALPDALDLLVVCVEAGLGIQASLARVARETARSHPVLSAEFELVTLETRAGKSSTDALRALAERTGVTEVSSLVAMLVQTERFGTRLADTLRVHADALRVQRLQRAEELAGKAPLKMLFPTLLIFLATLVVTVGPGMLQLFAFFAERTRG